MKKWFFRVSAALLPAVVLILAGFSWQAARREVLPAAKAAPATGRFVKGADVEIFVQEAGPADGLPVVFVHGTGAWSEAWRESMSALAATGARAIALDLPPFGFSQRPGSARYGKLDQGQRIVGVLDAFGIRQAVLVGHSFGGGPTMEAALLAPLAPPAVAASERPASYQGLKVPVFIIWGERDTITPLEQGQRLAKLAPHAELAVMRNVGHIPQIEDPAGFNELLLKAVAKAAIKASSASSSR